MPGRKRDNPQRIGTQDEAKRPSFCQYIPGERRVLVGDRQQQRLDGTEVSAHIEQRSLPVSFSVDLSNEEIENKPPSNGPAVVKKRGKRRRKKICVPKSQKSRPCKAVQILPAPTISEDTLASLPCVLELNHKYKFSTPIFHSHTPGLESFQIQTSRAGHPNSSCICIGKLWVSLEGSLPLNKLFSECGESLRVSLETSPLLPPVLKISDGVHCVYVGTREVALPMTSDDDLSDLCAFVSGRKSMRLSILPISEDVPLISELVIEVWAMELLCTVASPSELKFSYNVVGFRSLLEKLQPGCLDDLCSQPLVDSSGLSVAERIQQFYKNVQTLQKQSATPPVTVEPSSTPGLSAELRGYQCRAVEWMLVREGVGTCGACDDGGGSEAGEPELHKLWRKLPTTDQEIYFNSFSGKFSKQRFPAAPWPKGGILADEMGLGKTVEVLALILSHPWHGDSTPEHMPIPPSKEAESSREIKEKPLIENVPHVQALLNERDQSSVFGEACRTTGEVSSSSEVVQCLCGAVSEDGYEGEFVQCEMCLVWFHSACVDYSPQRDGVHFHCVRCLLEKPHPSGATLIISPQAIAQQWMDEIKKHTEPNAITAYMYHGVSRQRYVSPLELARYDIVMVTYETLCTEFYHAMSHEMSKTLRKRKRYSYSPSPLPAVLWWRVCLDEAQMVESTNVRAAEMTKKLWAINRWCVTGTPVQKQLLDLYGLLLFLNVDPYCHSAWFSRLVWEPYLRGYEKPIVELFAKVMWRNSKADVASELCLPDHSEEVHWLQFSSVEAYFYERQQEKCRADLWKVISGLSNGSTLSSLVQTTFNKMMGPLHCLRQACCHPQLIRSGSYLPTSLTNKTYVTMPRLLEKLTAQAKVEAREALRQLVAALNGLAAIHTDCNEYDAAVIYYREAMTVWQEHVSHDVDCDKLQRIHTMENLAEVLDSCNMSDVGGGRTLRDETLLEEAAALRSQYTEKVEGQVKAAAEGLFVVKNSIKFAQREFNWLQADYLEEIPPELVEEAAQTGETAEETGDQTSVELSYSGDQTGTSTEGIEAETNNATVADVNHTEVPSGKSVSVDQSQPGSTIDQSEPHVSVDDDSEAAGEMNDKDPSPKRKPPPAVKQPKPAITPSQPWWVGVCSWCDRHDLEENLLEAMRLEFTQLEGDPHKAPTGPTFTDLTGMTFYLSDRADKAQSSRESVLSSLDELCATPTFSIVDHAASCHLRNKPQEEDSEWEKLEPDPCPICVAESKIASYERHLFSEYERQKWAENPRLDHGEGSRKPGTMERIMKTLVLFSRQKGAPKKLQEAAHAFLGYLDLRKKEYDAIRSLWLALDKRVGAHDELNMASTRLRVMGDIEAMDEGYDKNDPFLVHPEELLARLHQFDAEKQMAKHDLKKCLGQVLYLKNLAKKNDGGGGKFDPCPVCDQLLEREWAVFSCGHPLCVECMAALIKQQPRHYFESSVTIKCPLCREPSRSAEVHYIRDGGVTEEGQDISVQGCLSTKIAAVVRTLIRIQQTEPGAKSLVFSTWREVLDLVALALKVNKIKYDFLKAKKSFQASLDHFKTSSDSNVLLLPINSGSKGLNIVEATHVLLVEPLLNLGAEQQAVGRVYRMGQTRPTKVHRFLVKKTVEENIFNLFNSHPDKAKLLGSKEKESELTLADIRALIEV